MSEQEKKLDFSLPDRPSKASAPAGGGVKWLLVIVALAVIANLVVTLLRSPARDSGDTTASGSAASQFSADSLKQLALKMEKQGLHSAATTAWKQYLAAAKPGDQEAAKIWYRIGKLHQDGEAYEAALDAYYRSESLHPGSELAADIGRGTQESLEALGKFAALRLELVDRVSLDQDAAKTTGEIVAEIGTQKISRAELDRQIEANIENQLARFASQLPEEERHRQKEAMLKRFASDEQRLQFLQGYIVQEILYRKAREKKLTEDPKVRAQLRDAERSLLAEQMMAAELTGKINITDGDLRTYYEANKTDFLEPASALVSHIQVTDEAAATTLLEQVKEADAATFADLAKDHSTDEATKESGGELTAPIPKGSTFIPGIGESAQAAEAIDAGEAGKTIDGVFKIDDSHHLFFVREKTPERQRPYEEVQREVYQALRARKEREVQEQLMNALQDEYDVVIHQSKFKPEATDQ